MQRFVTYALVALAVIALAALAVDVALHGQPNVLLLMTAAGLLGSAIAVPVARSQVSGAAGGLPCMECGHASNITAEIGFCYHCGSTRVWQAVRIDA